MPGQLVGPRSRRGFGDHLVGSALPRTAARETRKISIDNL
jgi:hypothetical protein